MHPRCCTSYSAYFLHDLIINVFLSQVWHIQQWCVIYGHCWCSLDRYSSSFSSATVFYHFVVPCIQSSLQDTHSKCGYSAVMFHIHYLCTNSPNKAVISKFILDCSQSLLINSQLTSTEILANPGSSIQIHYAQWEPLFCTTKQHHSNKDNMSYHIQYHVPSIKLFINTLILRYSYVPHHWQVGHIPPFPTYVTSFLLWQSEVLFPATFTMVAVVPRQATSTFE